MIGDNFIMNNEGYDDDYSMCTLDTQDVAKQSLSINRKDPYFYETYINRNRKSKKGDDPNKPVRTYRHKITAFGANPKHSKIRNAVTGIKYNYRVGSIEQDIYFKVIDSTVGYKNNQTPAVFFYDGPDEYERHQFQTVDSKTRESWSEKRRNVIARICK